MKEEVASTLKSSETEDWLDYHVIRPFCYLWAKLFARLGVHPNTVTIMSMFIGAASCIFFAHGCFHYEGGEGLIYNIIGILLLMLADIFDCTDGQLARMTGKKSKLGRILDGLAGYAWYIPIYAALVYRFYWNHDIEFDLLGIYNTPEATTIATIIVFLLAFVSGAICLAGQQRTADYYIQCHLFFLKGEKGSELDNSVQQQEIYDNLPADASKLERTFQKSYVAYTKLQEKKTPQFQRMMALLRKKYGDTENIPASVREDFRKHSLPLMKYNGLLTFNFRSAYMFLFCLLDVPVMAFLFEIIAMTLIERCVIRRHESFCAEIADGLEK
ncbi:MAG: CDP-alcohol phosphatidyltransferase family protein [Bacteroidales bacterium]|nr:CDP-alcohol phosphatidyltransferase family protein [Bacteroidales bacterium]